MSKKARLKAEAEAEAAESQKIIKNKKLQKLGIRAGAVVVVMLLLVGVLAQFNMLPNTTASLFSPEPVPTPSPSPTPVVLSKEYIYAGSRMLAVEEPNAQQQSATDLAIFRQSNGTWWILNGISGSLSGGYWGTSGDITIPADFDGDGKADIAIYRPDNPNTPENECQNNCIWYIIRSSDGAGQYAAFGLPGDKPVPADYDGDGKADVAVLRPSTNSTWYVLQSSTSSTASYTFGTTGDKAVPADYDGDGRADLAVWRNSDATFWIQQTTDNQTIAKAFGQAGDTPVIGDYDGDGKFDVATWRSDDKWRILYSSTGQAFTSAAFGLNYYDKPVQGDYDADGKTDIAVYRDGLTTGAQSYWYILKSSTSNNEMRTEAFGVHDDIPVPAPFRR